MDGGPIELGLLLNTAHHVRDDGARPDLSPVLDAAKAAEELGFDHVWVGDSSRMESGWPRADFVVVLAAMAATTQRVRLGVIPLSAPLREPVLLAHQLATLDVLSGGRLLVSPAIGKGGREGEREFAAVHVPYNERGARLSEILQIMRRLWTEPSVDFHGRYYEIEDASIFPKPINRPIPQYVATGGAEAGLRRAGRYGDGWFTADASAEHFAEAWRKVQQYAAEAGRDPSQLLGAGLYATFHLDEDGEKARIDAPEFMRAYFGTHANTTFDFFGSPAEIADRLQPFADAGLKLIVARFVEQNLPRQTTLMGDVLARLRPSV